MMSKYLKSKERIEEEFETILKLLDFSNNGYETFSKFYVDGRLNYHVIIDENNLKKGIRELRYLDPRKVRLIREMDQVPLKDQFQSATVKKYEKNTICIPKVVLVIILLEVQSRIKILQDLKYQKILSCESHPVW